MYWASHKLFWIPLYLFFFYLAYKQVGKRIWLVAIAAGALILLSDQLSVHAFKNVFLRLRPCHEFALQTKVHLLNGHCGGTYGFISSHASNTFALAMFLSLFFGGRIKYLAPLLFVWAIFVAYSRIYSGVHYPGDVLGGAIVGIGIGITVYKIYHYSNSRIFKEE